MIAVDVLVVGAGPVGLSVGLELAHQGVDFLVVDQGDGAVTHPKVGSVGPRSMEFFRRWGIASQVRTAGWPDDHPLDGAWVTAVGGHEIHRVSMGTMADEPQSDVSPERESICPQHWLMPLLLQAVENAPTGRVLLRRRLTEIVQSDGDVRAVLTDQDSEETCLVRAQYVVAADGASSPIRHELGITSPALHESRTFRNILFRAPELRERLGDRTALFYFLMLSTGLRFPLRAIDGRGLYRLTVGAGPESAMAAKDLVRAAVTVDTPLEVLSDLEWHLTHRVAERFRSGRVFLVGDAAHTLSPSGGFGMNTGISNAVNLAWKLAAAVHGWAGPGLLDTYGTECRPIALRSLEEANVNLRRTLDRSLPDGLSDDTAAGERIRAEMGQRLARSGVAREFESLWVHLGLRYISPIVVLDGAEPPEGGIATWRQSSVPGCRAPHGQLDDGRSTLDLFGPGFHLLTCSDVPGVQDLASAFEAADVPFAATLCKEREVAERYERDAVLVRPDGHVAWRGDVLPADPAALVGQVRGATAASDGAS